jgi:hypothetical protein
MVLGLMENSGNELPRSKTAGYQPAPLRIAQQAAGNVPSEIQQLLSAITEWIDYF